LIIIHKRVARKGKRIVKLFMIIKILQNVCDIYLVRKVVILAFGCVDVAFSKTKSKVIGGGRHASA
jgi:hypothetical protein